MRVAASAGDVIEAVRKVPTPERYEDTIDQFMAITQELVHGGIVKAAGCIAAQIDAERGLFDANNRPSWNGRHFDKDLSAALNVPVIVDNDCAVIGLGEFARGGGRGSRNIAYVTVSTGVGAAHIRDGVIMPFNEFFFGHTKIDGVEIEALISGTAVRKKFGIEPKELAAIEERNALADTLARGLAVLSEKWSPERIVLGGSMIVGVNPIPLGHAAATLSALHANAPELKMAELGDTGGLVGAAILANQ